MAKTRKHHSTLLILFGLCLFLDVTVASVRERIDLQLHHVHMAQKDIDKSVVHVEKRSLRHHRQRRDAEDSLCQSQENVLQGKWTKQPEFLVTNKFMNETKYSIAIAWVGENTGKLLVVTTEELLIFAKESTVYQSNDDGKNFNRINDRVENAHIHKDNGLQKDPHNPSKVFLVAYSPSSSSHNSLLWITEDGGDHFKKVQLPFILTGSITFYPDKKHPNILLTQTQGRELYISKDGGYGWKLIKTNVIHFKWGTDASGENGVLYATLNDRGLLTDNKLVKTTDLGESWNTIKENVYTFGSQGKFLYASIRVPNSPSRRLMHVSTNEGNTWNEVQLPTITEDRFYSILDMSEGMVFMHVDSPNDSGQGTLYISDASGIIFSESLPHHLYPNFVDLTDFYKVRSMRGVYLASQIDDDNSIHSVITFDRGASWQPVKRPQGVMCKNESKACYLQIHNSYSMFRGIQAQPPLSIENAVGLIIVHGHVADALQTTPADVFVSSDGGYTWNKALDGPHTVQIADHGGLLVAIPSVPHPKVIKFSTDEGRCWHTFNFTTEDLVITGLLTEPGNRAMSVGIWGFGQTDRVWRVHVLNFTKIIDVQCDKDKDYENWVAHGDNSKEVQYRGCLLGKRETCRRLKKDSLCANGYNYEVTKTEEICQCTVDDFDCDYGYKRTLDPTGKEVCIEDPKFKNKKLDICVAGTEEEIITKGYRKVPGSKCNGGFEPIGEKIIDLNIRCNMNSKELIAQEIEMGKKSHYQNSAVWVVLTLAVFLLAFMGVFYFAWKYNLLKRGTGTYAYSSLTQNEDGLEEALLNNGLYDETTDEVAVTTETGTTPNNYSTMNGSTGSPVTPVAGAPRGSAVNKYHVQPHLKNYHDDSDVDMLD